MSASPDTPANDATVAEVQDEMASVSISDDAKVKKEKKKKKKKKKKSSVDEVVDAPAQREGWWIELYCCRNVNGFMLPPRRSAGPLFAKQWGIKDPKWNGILRVKGKDNELKLEFENRDRTLFAQSVIIKLNTLSAQRGIDFYIESVADSKRYFATQIRDPRSGRTAAFGFGFPEKNTSHAFDMNACIADQARMVQRHMDPAELKKLYPDSGNRAAELPAPEGFAAADDQTTFQPQSQIELKSLPVLTKSNVAPMKLEMTLGSPDKKHKKHKKKKSKKRRKSKVAKMPQVSAEDIQTSISPPGGPSIPADPTPPANASATADDDWGDFEGGF